jgi:hypothetical protein
MDAVEAKSWLELELDVKTTGRILPSPHPVHQQQKPFPRIFHHAFGAGTSRNDYIFYLMNPLSSVLPAQTFCFAKQIVYDDDEVRE